MAEISASDVIGNALGQRILQRCLPTTSVPGISPLFNVSTNDSTDLIVPFCDRQKSSYDLPGKERYQDWSSVLAHRRPITNTDGPDTHTFPVATCAEAQRSKNAGKSHAVCGSCTKSCKNCKTHRRRTSSRPYRLRILFGNELQCKYCRVNENM